MTEKWRQTWLGETEGVPYGEVMYRRATGELPEMESAKAVAAQLAKIARDGDRILDVGCGAGHYLRSLKMRLKIRFSYTGLDSTERFIALARKAFDGTEGVEFMVGDVFALGLPDRSCDIVMSNNVLLHLPSIALPVAEMCRVAERWLLLRTLIGERSFRIMDVADPDGTGDEFDESGEPKAFHFFNIYSRAYVSRLMRAVPRVKSFDIVEDREFDPAAVEANGVRREGMRTPTRIIGDRQINGYIIQPWAFVIAEMQS